MKSPNIKDTPKTPIFQNVTPMLATLADSPPLDEGWIYEVKWDGYRALSICNKKKVNLISRNSKSFNDKYYSIRQALEQLNIQAVLDGEIVVVQDSGLVSFENLQEWRSEADGELAYYVFDVLWYNGHDLTSLALSKRKELLKQIIPTHGPIKLSSSFEISPLKFLEAAKKLGVEGMIAKRADSEYSQGFRSKAWLKIKTENAREFVIGGYTKNEHSPKPFSALLVGVYENKSLVYAGKVGTGFNEATQKKLLAQFKPFITKKCPFSYIPDVNKPSRFQPNPPPSEVFWLVPKLVCEVSYREMSKDGILRHPSFKSMRDDKKATDVHNEVPIKTSKIPKKSSLKIVPKENGERHSLLNPSEDTQVKTINNHQLKFNHLNKVFWPKENLTKRDLLNYYYQVAPYILPYLKDRPQTLNRFPNGIEGLSFYQKDVTGKSPEWIKQFPYTTSEGEDKNYLVLQNEYDLLWMANLGAIEMHPWNSTVEKPDHPTWCMIDIDPSEKNTFDQVIETAQVTKQVLDALLVNGYCKTSGATGIHVYIPMGNKYTFDQCQLFCRMIATEVHKRLPKITSIERLNVNRRGKVYVDFLQNRPKATLAAPYSVRPQPGAPVSMPLHWEEVKKGLKPQQFTIKNALERIKNEGDLFKPVIGKGINLQKILKNFET